MHHGYRVLNYDSYEDLTAWRASALCNMERRKDDLSRGSKLTVFNATNTGDNTNSIEPGNILMVMNDDEYQQRNARLIGICTK